MLSLLLAFCPPADACAGFFHDPDVLAESSYQEVILSKGDGFVQAEYAVKVEANSPEFGWVIPIPGNFKALNDGDSQHFSDLFTLTAPIWDLEEPPEGCGPASKSSDAGNLADTGGSQGVTVVYQGSTPTYGYTVLEATQADALNSWLQSHGWEAGETEAAIAEYVQEGGFQFVAINLALDISTETVLADLPPIAIQYDGDNLVFPSRMARYAEAEQLKTIIYVQGDQRAHLAEGSSWHETDLDLVWDDGESIDYMKYQLYPEKIGEIGYDGGFAVTWAGEWENGWVTRFETLAPRELHTTDVAFRLNGGTDAPLALTVSNMGGCQTPDGAKALAIFPLLAAFIRRRQR